MLIEKANIFETINQNNRGALKKLWPHDPEKPETWKYSDVIVKYGNGGPHIQWIFNPDFIYAHLDPYNNIGEKPKRKYTKKD